MTTTSGDRDQAATIKRLRKSVRDLDRLCAQQQELIREQAQELAQLRNEQETTG